MTADDVLVCTATLGDSCEEWRDVRGYEGLYQVSDQGRVKSLSRAIRCGRNRRQLKVLPEGIRKPQRSKRGAYVIFLSKAGVAKPHYVHHLVLEAFVGPRPKGMECRHFPDRDTSNNRLSNLSWGTSQENNDDRRIHGTMPLGSKHQNAKVTEEQVLRIRALYAQDPKKYNQNQLAKMYGLTRSGVEQIVHRTTWTHV